MRRLKSLLFVCLTSAAVFNLYLAYAQAIRQIQDRTTIPLHSLGFPFMGLENVFKNVSSVGYYTDKDLGQPLAIAQFEQAQYILAPTVLNLNHTPWRWAIFDCSSPQAAMEAMKRLGLMPLKINHGIILAYNPNGL
jgi:hypothetical protein